MIVFFYPLLFALFLLPIPIVLGSLRSVVRQPKLEPGDEPRRARKALESAVALNLLCLPLPYLLFFGYGFLVIPAAMFGIAASVAGLAGRRPLVVGPLACPWFPLPLMLYWGYVAPPVALEKFVGLPSGEESANRPAIVLLWFAWWAVGLLGAGAAALILRGKSAGPVVQ